MTRKCLSELAIAALAFLNSPAAADLVVIYDNGNTRPISEFLGPLETSKPPSNQTSAKSALMDLADAATLLPIESPGLTPGPVVARAYSQPFASAIFLIGADVQSLQWLRQHRNQLVELQAVGLLVQARSIDDLEVVAAIADGLPITLASGTDVAKVLGIRHYPVAVSGGQIWQ
jgi:integrating conjugative element protein (TIGR03765 family)